MVSPDADANPCICAASRTAQVARRNRIPRLSRSIPEPGSASDERLVQAMSCRYRSYTHQELVAALTTVNDDLALASYRPGVTRNKEVCFD